MKKEKTDIITVSGGSGNMRVINISIERKKYMPLPLCACIGYFDGMHKGHQALIHETVAMAKRYGCESAMITFDPDPWVTVKGLHDVQHITTMRQRMNIAVSLGINNIVVLKFTKQMSELSPEAFVNEILGQLNLRGIVCGFDFHYGAKGMGSCESLKQQAAFEVKVVDAVEDEAGKISSTRISAKVAEGDIPAVNAMLGYEYQMEGIVIHGRHKGTSMGFATANIRYSREYILPRPGVYAGYGTIGSKKYRAMINLGHNPTMNYTQDLSLEAHFIDFKGDLYGKMITLSFIRRMRPEMKFKNRDNLIMQLTQDLRDINKTLNAYEQSLSRSDENSDPGRI